MNGSRAAETGVAPDGNPVALYLALSGVEEADIVHAANPEGAAILELGCGFGRVSRELAQHGHRITGIDNSPEMLAHFEAIAGMEGVLSDIATLDLSPRQWLVVLMASHLVNDDLGPAFLATAARHVAADGCVLVQRYEPGWVDTRCYEQTFTAHDVDNARRDAMAAAVALTIYAPLDEHGLWVRLTPASATTETR